MKKQQKLPPGFWKLPIGLSVAIAIWMIIRISLGLPKEARWIDYGVIPIVVTLLFWRSMKKAREKLSS